jgi:hypothetical protein
MEFNFDFDDILPRLCFAAASLIVVGVVAASVGQTMVTQNALNQSCKTNYNFIQVALAGNNLSRICQIENQTITVR